MSKVTQGTHIITRQDRSVEIEIEQKGIDWKAVATLRLFTGEIINIVEREYYYSHTRLEDITADLDERVNFGIIHPAA